jgi:hypothetical protein
VTYYAGDDTTLTFTATHPGVPPSNLTGTPVVTAQAADGSRVALDAAAWLGDPATTRDIAVPISVLPAGLWSLRLRITSGPDLFLGNVVVSGDDGVDVPPYDPGAPADIDGGTP